MRTPVFAVALLASCTTGGGEPARSSCTADSDCTGTGETCVFDFDATDAGAVVITRSYCARRCAVNKDCLPTQECRMAVDTPVSGAFETRVCIDRVRSCSTTELCNGLDDDCDGTIDGASCTPVTDCLDDEPCGAFICRAPENQPAAICAPANETASLEDFAACTSDDQCRTGLCETGVCSPLCRPRSDECPGDAVCASAIGPRGRPPHNNCQQLCMTSASCPVPQECVWRDVYRGPDAPANTMLHAFVCSTPGPDRKALGMPCSGANLAGDDECAHGLCFGGVCTRACSIGDRCSDVGAGFRCNTSETLRYGTMEIAVAICEAP